MLKPYKYYCTNPQCTSSRLFAMEEIDGHKKCNPWIITPNHINLQKQPIPPQLKCQQNFNFQQLGLNEIFKFHNKLENWPTQINKIFQQMKIRICQQIDNLKNNKLSQFYTIYQEVINAITQIQCMATKLKDGTAIQGMRDMEMYNFNKVIEYGVINLYQVDKITYYFQKNIPEQLNNVSKLIQSSGLTYRQIQQKRRKVGLQKTNQYFMDNEILVNDKIQKLTTLFQTSMVKLTHDPQLSTFKTNCFICQQICYSNKDNTKKTCLQQLLSHLTTNHSKQIYLNYMSRVLRYEVEQISFHKLLQKIDYQKIGQFYVIDRENAGTIEKPLVLEPDKLWIEVMNKQNRNLAKSQYIIADSTRKDAADILMTVLIYEMVKCNTGRITLVTKDHFGITLQQVLGSIYPQKIRCMIPKDFMEMLQNKEQKTQMSQ